MSNLKRVQVLRGDYVTKKWGSVTTNHTVCTSSNQMVLHHLHLHQHHSHHYWGHRWLDQWVRSKSAVKQSGVKINLDTKYKNLLKFFQKFISLKSSESSFLETYCCQRFTGGSSRLFLNSWEPIQFSLWTRLALDMSSRRLNVPILELPKSDDFSLVAIKNLRRFRSYQKSTKSTVRPNYENVI